MPGERVKAGAVGAVSRSLDQMNRNLRAAQELVASGEHVVELDPADIEGSMLRDRLGVDQASQAQLQAAIAQSGQQVPILVRPLPGASGRYQVAYGHRRLNACRALGRKVLAIVRSLNDEQLLIAQGQENSARRDLSFIERASFALKLEDQGVDRSAIMAALATDKTEISKLIGVARAVSMPLIEAIGPAPKAGRPRWQALAELLTGEKARKKLATVLAEPNFAALNSDQRFILVFDWMAGAAAPPEKKRWVMLGTKKFVHIAKSGRKFTLEIDEKSAPDFGEYVTRQLPELYEAYVAAKPRV